MLADFRRFRWGMTDCWKLFKILTKLRNGLKVSPCKPSFHAVCVLALSLRALLLQAAINLEIVFVFAF